MELNLEKITPSIIIRKKSETLLWLQHNTVYSEGEQQQIVESKIMLGGSMHCLWLPSPLCLYSSLENWTFFFFPHTSVNHWFFKSTVTVQYTDLHRWQYRIGLLSSAFIVCHIFTLFQFWSASSDQSLLLFMHKTTLRAVWNGAVILTGIWPSN